MRITLTVEALAPQLTGIGRYTHALARLLPDQEDVRQIRFYRNGQWFEDIAPLLAGEDAPRRKKGIFRPIRSWAQRRFFNKSVVHGPNYFLPAGVEGGVITVHDLSVFRYPETHPKERLEHFERLFLDSLKRSAHIITDTEWVRREVIEYFSLPAEKVTAVHLGFDDFRYRPLADEVLASQLAALDLVPGGYALVVATLEPRKKVRELLHAWGRLPGALRMAFPLVLAGANGWLNDDLHEEIDKGLSDGWLRFLGYVDENIQPALYGGAALFIYPSVYEGFGLPPLEAMACGAPVLVAAGTCLEEVCGDAATYTNPDDPERLLADVTHLLESPSLRQQMSVAGIARAQHFTWDGCAMRTTKVYRSVEG